jgi:hypothetical protein
LTFSAEICDSFIAIHGTWPPASLRREEKDFKKHENEGPMMASILEG